MSFLDLGLRPVAAMATTSLGSGGVGGNNFERGGESEAEEIDRAA